MKYYIVDGFGNGGMPSPRGGLDEIEGIFRENWTEIKTYGKERHEKET